MPVSDNSPDVLIIGAGLAGASVAWHLAPHASVALIEQGSAPGQEATSQSAGLVRRLSDDPVDRVLSQRTHAFLDKTDWTDATRRTGAVMALAHDALHLHDPAAHLRAASIPIDALDRPERMAPVLEGASLQAAWFLPDERIAHGPTLVDHFLRGAQDYGARLECNVQVTGLTVHGDQVMGVETTDGHRPAGAVVFASGAWGGALAAQHGLQRPLVPLERAIGITHSHPAATPQHPWVWIDDAGLYVRPEGTGFLACPCDERVRSVPVGPGSTGSPDEDQRTLLTRKLARHIPALASTPFSHWRTGLRTFTPDRRPLLGSDPALEGLWWAAGLGGSGVSNCTGIGEALSTWMQGGETPWLDPHLVAPGRRMLSRWPIWPTGTLDSATLIGGYG